MNDQVLIGDDVNAESMNWLFLRPRRVKTCQDKYQINQSSFYTGSEFNHRPKMPSPIISERASSSAVSPLPTQSPLGHLLKGGGTAAGVIGVMPFS